MSDLNFVNPLYLNNPTDVECQVPYCKRILNLHSFGCHLKDDHHYQSSNERPIEDNADLKNRGTDDNSNNADCQSIENSVNAITLNNGPSNSESIAECNCWEEYFNSSNKRKSQMLYEMQYETSNSNNYLDRVIKEVQKIDAVQNVLNKINEHEIEIPTSNDNGSEHGDNDLIGMQRICLDNMFNMVEQSEREKSYGSAREKSSDSADENIYETSENNHVQDYHQSKEDYPSVILSSAATPSLLISESREAYSVCSNSSNYPEPLENCFPLNAFSETTADMQIRTNFCQNEFRNSPTFLPTAPETESPDFNENEHVNSQDKILMDDPNEIELRNQNSSFSRSSEIQGTATNLEGIPYYPSNEEYTRMPVIEPSNNEDYQNPASTENLFYCQSNINNLHYNSAEYMNVSAGANNYFYQNWDQYSSQNNLNKFNPLFQNSYVTENNSQDISQPESPNQNQFVSISQTHKLVSNQSEGNTEKESPPNQIKKKKKKTTLACSQGIISKTLQKNHTQEFSSIPEHHHEHMKGSAYKNFNYDKLNNLVFQNITAKDQNSRRENKVLSKIKQCREKLDQLPNDSSFFHTEECEKDCTYSSSDSSIESDYSSNSDEVEENEIMFSNKEIENDRDSFEDSDSDEGSEDDWWSANAHLISSYHSAKLKSKQHSVLRRVVRKKPGSEHCKKTKKRFRKKKKASAESSDSSSFGIRDAIKTNICDSDSDSSSSVFKEEDLFNSSNVDEQEMYDGSSNYSSEEEPPFISIFSKATNVEQQEVDVDQQEIDVDQQEVDVDQQEVDVDQQEVDVDQQEVDVDQQEVDVDQQEVDVDQQEVDVDQQEVDVDQQEVVVDQQEVDVEMQEVDGKNHEIDGEKQEVDVDQQEVDVDQQEVDVDQQEVVVDQQEVDVEMQEVDSKNQEVDVQQREVNVKQKGADFEPSDSNVPSPDELLTESQLTEILARSFTEVISIISEFLKDQAKARKKKCCDFSSYISQELFETEVTDSLVTITPTKTHTITNNVQDVESSDQFRNEHSYKGHCFTYNTDFFLDDFQIDEEEIAEEYENVLVDHEAVDEEYETVQVDHDQINEAYEENQVVRNDVRRDILMTGSSKNFRENLCCLDSETPSDVSETSVVPEAPNAATEFLSQSHSENSRYLKGVKSGKRKAEEELTSESKRMFFNENCSDITEDRLTAEEDLTAQDSSSDTEDKDILSCDDSEESDSP